MSRQDINNVIKKCKNIYFIGIKGVAMTALAIICKQMGMKVTGSDIAEEFITDKILKQKQISFFNSFATGHLLKVRPDIVVVGQSWTEGNIEHAYAIRKKIAVITDSDMRGYLSNLKKTIAVTGVHGKTTTTALLSYIFKQAHKNPSYLIGTAKIPALGALGVGGNWDNGRYFIVEGDEYAKSKKDAVPKFLDLDPYICIITSIEWEHVDVFKNTEALEKAFFQLIKNTKKRVIACVDYLSVRKIIKSNKKKIITYGFSNYADWRIYNYTQQKNFIRFSVRYQEKDIGTFEMKLLGRHNALNGLACMIAAREAGINISTIKKSLLQFAGLERRFQEVKKNNILFIDDYGHHPTEILLTTKAIRDKYADRKIWCVFQPHMASRTKALLGDFAKSFTSVDAVIVNDIFSSAREKSIGITSEKLAQSISKFHENVHYLPTLQKTALYLKKYIQKNDVIITMGAGDVYKLRDYF